MKLLLTGFLLLMVWGAQAETPLAKGGILTLGEAVAMVLGENAELMSLRARWEALQEKPAQAGALPNPMFTFSGMDAASGGTWPNTDEKRYMVQQEFSWRGKRGLRKGIAVQDAEIMRLELETATRDMVREVKETYFDLVAVRNVIGILQEEEEILRRLVEVADTQYATGMRTKADALSAQTERTLLKQKGLDVQAQQTTLHAKLNTLLNRRVDDPVEVAFPPSPSDWGENPGLLIALASTNRLEVQAAKAQIERYKLEKMLMAKESLPDYKLGVEYRNIGAGEDLVMVSISVDLPVWRSNIGAGIRESEKWRISWKAAGESAERRSALEVQDAFFKLQAARRTLDLYRSELIPLAEARYSSREADYRTGKSDFMDLLESERFLLEAKRMCAMAEGAVGVQGARLEWALGAGRGPEGVVE